MRTPACGGQQESGRTPPVGRAAPASRTAVQQLSKNGRAAPLTGQGCGTGTCLHTGKGSAPGARGVDGVQKRPELCTPTAWDQGSPGGCLLTRLPWPWRHTLPKQAFRGSQGVVPGRLLPPRPLPPCAHTQGAGPGDQGLEQEGLFMAPDNWTPGHGV